MSKNARFFEDGRQAAAVLKHGVLRRYLSSYSRMVGKNSPDHSVGFLDAYAGNGEYVHPITNHKTPGSPLIALDVAERIVDRRLHCVFVERNGTHASNLRRAVELNGYPLAAVIPGDIEKHVDDSLNGFSDMPLFVLLDPFGTALQTQVLVEKLLHRPGNWATEVLFNFSIDAVRRIGSRYYQAEDSPGRSASLQRLDRWLGGDWWREHFESRRHQPFDPNRASDAADAVFRDYIAQVRNQTDFGTFVVPIRRLAHHKPIFNLTLFFRRNYAVVPFNEAVSLASQDWRRHLQDLDLTSADLEDFRNPTLPGLSRVPELKAVFADDEAAYKEDLIERIEQSILEGLRTRDSLSIRNDFGVIFAGSIGAARTLHLREAWKRLADRGFVHPPPKSVALDGLSVRKVRQRAG